MLLYLRHVANYCTTSIYFGFDVHVITVYYILLTMWTDTDTWFSVLYGLMTITKVVVDMSGPASGG